MVLKPLMIDNVIQTTCVLTNVANCKNECKGKGEHQKVSKSTVSKYVDGAENIYAAAQMQLHTHACVLLCQHVSANMLPVTCDGVLASLTYCTRVLHEGLHTRMCYSGGYSHVRVTHVHVQL